MPDEKEENEDRPRVPVSGAEWAVAAVGLLLVLAVVAQLVREAVRSPQRPPDVTVVVDTVSRGAGGWRVGFEARNAGDETAAELTVEGTLVTPDGRTLVREARVDYLPARSTRGGGMFFPVDPRAGTLRLEATGYQDP